MSETQSDRRRGSQPVASFPDTGSAFLVATTDGWPGRPYGVATTQYLSEIVLDVEELRSLALCALRAAEWLEVNR